MIERGEEKTNEEDSFHIVTVASVVRMTGVLVVLVVVIVPGMIVRRMIVRRMTVSRMVVRAVTVGSVIVIVRRFDRLRFRSMIVLREKIISKESIEIIERKTYSMIMSTMRMTVMMMSTRSDHPHQINRQSNRTNDQQLRSIHLGRIQQSLNRFENDEDRYETEEESVGESRERFDPRVTVSEFPIRLPRRHDACE